MDQKKNIGFAIENAQLSNDVYPFISKQASGILTALGMSLEQSLTWLEENIKGRSVGSLFEFEAALHGSLSEFRVYEKLESCMAQRADAWFAAIEKHLLPGSVLDLGGGSGEVSILVHDKGNSVTVADTINWLNNNLDFLPVSAESVVDVESGAFDQVLLLTVFHHSGDPVGLIKEAFRIAKKRVVFIESVTEGVKQYMYGVWIDWFYNRVIHYSADVNKKINVPGNLKPATAWEQLVWRHTGYTPSKSERLGIFQHLNPEEHHLFVYDK